MFVHAKRSVQYGKTYEYLQICESYREGAKVKQRLIASLGRLDHLTTSGQLEGILKSFGKFSESLRVVGSARASGMVAHTVKSWGPSFVFGWLWERQGLPQVLENLASGRKFGFDPERVAFALALQRLCEPGSDLQESEWLKDVEGLPEIGLHQVYRAVGWLAEVREELERTLFFRDRDLFHQEIDLVFLDTTSTYVYRDEETEFCKRGYSRDKRPDLPRMVLCVAVDRHGWPIAWEIFPGNTADKDAFTHVVTRLRARFRIGRVIVVADRGMISKDTIDLLTKHETAPFDYILGVRMRKDPDAVDLLQMEREFDPIAPGLGVAERTLSGKRYVVCYNEAEAKKDAAAREAIMASLQENLERGETKSLVGNTGYRRFLEGERGSWRIDFQKAIDDELFDGVFVLRTNTDLPAAEVVKTYKGLWRVERTFREQKSTLELRPLFHHNDDTRIGRIVASFLALGLEVDLQRRLDEKIINVSWPTLMRELKNLRVVDLQLGDTRYRLRTDPTPNVSAAFKAIGMHPPPRIREIPADRRAKFSGKTEIAP